MPEGKWITGLTPDASAQAAASAVLTARFAVVRHFLPLAAEKPYEDVEHVHQLRVATRRSGAALRAFADALPRKHWKATQRTLRAIRRAAGDARDCDVFLLGLPTAKPLAAASARPALDFLVGYAFGERAAAQSRLVEAATEFGAPFTEQSQDLPTRAHEPTGTGAPANFGELAARYLGELFHEFTAAAEANPTAPAALHALRIRGKRLRYAIEIFADCFPSALKEEVYPLVEQVQELLGEVQDAVVGTERLAAIRDRVQAVMPGELPRLRKGIDGLMKSLKAKVPAGKKAFSAWRKDWLGLMKLLKLEVLKATVI